MLRKKLSAVFLTLTLTFSLSLMAMAETFDSHEVTITVSKIDKLFVERTPTLGTSTAIPDSDPELSEGFDWKPLGGELMESGRYLRKTYDSYSIMPATLRWMWKKTLEEENPYELIVIYVVNTIILPADFVVSRFYGSFRGSYFLGRAGDHLIEASMLFPSQQALLMEKAGKDLRTCRTLSLINNGLFYGGLSVIVVDLYRTLASDKKDISGKVLTFGGIAMTAGHGLQLLPIHYAGSAGRKLEAISSSLPSAEHRRIMGEAGRSLQTYESRTYWGYGLEALGTAITVGGVAWENDTVITTGSLTTLAGWIISSPVAVRGIKSAAVKLDELGDRLMYWKE